MLAGQRPIFVQLSLHFHLELATIYHPKRLLRISQVNEIVMFILL